METEKQRAKRYADYFNLSIEQWEKIEKYQNGVCFACTCAPASGIRLATDHDHDTGLIRGLLCNHCNHLLGKIENAIKRFPKETRAKFVHPLRAILSGLQLYLQKPPAVSALGSEIFTYPGRLGTKKHRKWLKKNRK